MAGEKILDIGFAGEAQPLVHELIRKKLPNACVVGIDNNLEAVFKHRLTNTLVGDAVILPFAKASFNTVMLLEIMEHFDVTAIDLLRESRRVLRTSGRLFLTTPNPYAWERWLWHWLVARRVYNRTNYRNFLGHPDHKMFWEPLSLINILSEHHLRVIAITTKNHSIPFLSRWIKGLRAFDLPFYPCDRVGAYTCMIAEAC